MSNGHINAIFQIITYVLAFIIMCYFTTANYMKFEFNMNDLYCKRLAHLNFKLIAQEHRRITWNKLR